MVIFFDQIYKIVLPIQQVLQTNKLGQTFFLSPFIAEGYAKYVGFFFLTGNFVIFFDKMHKAQFFQRI